jgi:acyl-CoA hydrolase
MAPRWVDRIGADDVVFLGSACGEPQSLVETLVEHRGRWRELRLLTGLQGSAAPYAAHPEHFRLTTFMASRRLRGGFSSGAVDHIPASVHRTARLLSQGRVRVDVALVQVSPPDRRGMCSLGVSVAYTRAAVAAARVVVAEVNPQMPSTRGEGDVHVSEIDELVPSDRQVLTVPAPVPTPESAAIGRHVSGLVPDGATLQVGVGGVSDAIWEALSGHHDLTVHAGAAGDAVRRLLEAGVITGKKAAPDPTRPVTVGQLIGTADLYRFAHENDDLWLAQPELTHNPAVLAGIPGFTSVVSALQVDLRGQVNSETLGGVQVAGVGGALDFAMGASLAPNGLSVVALPATARGGIESRIVERLPDGVVTLPATLVDVVVTEHGVADLRGLPLGARREALTALAAPPFRERLSQENRDDQHP